LGEVAEEQGALRPWARKGGDKKRKTGGVLREKEELFFSSIKFDGGAKKKFIVFICAGGHFFRPGRVAKTAANSAGETVTSSGEFNYAAATSQSLAD